MEALSSEVAGVPEGFEQGAVMSSEVYSRTFSEPGCTMSIIKGKPPLLPPSALPSPPFLPHAHKHATRASTVQEPRRQAVCGQASGGIQGSPV